MGTGTLSCTLSPGLFAGTAGWKELGSPAGSKGYKYINKSAPTSDPCKTVILKEKVIKILAKATGGLPAPLASGSNPDVSTVLTLGADDYCALWVAPHFKEKADRLIKAKDQPAPGACPAGPTTTTTPPSTTTTVAPTTTTSGASTTTVTTTTTTTTLIYRDACWDFGWLLDLCNFTWPFDTYGATTDGLEHPACGQIFNDVWFCWEVPSGIDVRHVRIETCDGTTLDTKLAVYGPFVDCSEAITACVPDSGLLWTCNDDACGLQSSVEIAGVSQDQAYLIRLGSSSESQTGTGTFHMDCFGFTTTTPSTSSTTTTTTLAGAR